MFVKLENLWQYLKNVAARIKTKIITISIKDAFDIGENMAILKENGKSFTILNKETGNEKLAFVGDGINDAPVLARADIGIAMGSMGSDAAIEAADIVLMDDDISKIPATVRIARRTLGIVRENIVFALSVKLLVLVLGAFGLANMWEAVFADVGVSVIAILNSARALKTK